MKAALLLFLLTVFVSPLAAEDWTTTDGKTYKNVKVVSHDAAYVTILHEDGGGRVLLATLKPDLQKRFGYDPVKAAAEIAAVAAQDEKDKEALAREQQQAQQRAAQGQDEVNAAVAQAALPPPPDTNAPPAGYPTSGDVANEGPAYGQSEIDDYSGYYGGYGAYGYGYGGYGYGGYGAYTTGHRDLGNHYGTQGFTGRTYGGAASSGFVYRPGVGGAASALPAGHR